MLNWQFLLQKEGYPIWEAIDSPELTIEAGIYRILGRGNCQEKEAEIHCTYQDFSQGKSSNCLSKKVRRINPVGLVMIIPFTYFNPGYWGFSCRSTTFEEIFGESWYESFQLQVLPEINQTEIPKKFRNKLIINSQKERNISSSSIFKLKTVENIFAPAQMFGFPREIPSNKASYPSKAAEFFAQRKGRAILLHKETVTSLAGVALNIIENKYLKLLELFFKAPLPQMPQPIQQPARHRKTETEDLSFKLNLPEITKMVRVTTKLRVSLGQILPPKISDSSVGKKQRNSPQLPKIGSSAIPTINLNKPTSFKIKKERKKIWNNFRKNQRDSIDLKFEALKSKERFWAHLQSLIVTPDSDLEAQNISKE